MKRTLTFALLALTLTAVAQADDVKIPQRDRLHKVYAQKSKTLKANYERQQAALNKEYVAQLESLKKALMRQEKLTEAMAIKEEIDSLITKKRPPLVGTWVQKGATASFVVHANGTAYHNVLKCGGKWEATDRLAKKFQITWDNGIVDILKVRAGGTIADGKTPSTGLKFTMLLRSGG